MKKTLLPLLLALCMSFSLSIGASAAMTYVPENITYQNIDGKQLAIKTYTLLPDQNPSALMEPDFEFDGFNYRYSSMVKEEMTFKDESEHTEVVTITTSSKNLEDILAQLEPTIDYSDGHVTGVLALDHNSITTEAAGYTSYSYTVSATKNYSGLDRNDSSYIERTVVKDGRTLNLNNVTWAVESTALVGDDLVPATYCAVATYTGTGYSSKATGYVSTAEYKGTVTASGVSSIRYTVTYIGTPIEQPTPVETPEPVPPRTIPAAAAIGGLMIFAAAVGALLFSLLARSNVTVYEATGKDNEYIRLGRLHVSTRNPVIRLDKLKNIPAGDIAIEIDEQTAKRLNGKTVSIRYFDRSFSQHVENANGPFWFGLNVGDIPDSSASRPKGGGRE